MKQQISFIADVLELKIQANDFACPNLLNVTKDPP